MDNVKHQYVYHAFIIHHKYLKNAIEHHCLFLKSLMQSMFPDIFRHREKKILD